MIIIWLNSIQPSAVQFDYLKSKGSKWNSKISGFNFDSSIKKKAAAVVIEFTNCNNLLTLQKKTVKTQTYNSDITIAGQR